MHHNLEYWDDRLAEKVLEWNHYRELDDMYVRLIDSTSKKARERHEENELHMCGSMIMYFKKDLGLSIKEATKRAEFFYRQSHLLPVIL
jgi:hypothetical protein